MFALTGQTSLHVLYQYLTPTGMLSTPTSTPLAPLLHHRPGQNFGPDADFLYGHCIYTGAAGSSFALAEELATAARR